MNTMPAASTTTGSDALTRTRTRLVALLPTNKRIRRPQVAKHEPRVSDGQRHEVVSWRRMTDIEVHLHLTGQSAWTDEDVRYVNGGVLVRKGA